MGKSDYVQKVVDINRVSTKADFYTRKGKKFTYIGSCIDGQPPSEGGRTEIINICNSVKEDDFVNNVKVMVHNPIHQGSESWIWTYSDPFKTNYIYIFNIRSVKCSCYGSKLTFDPFCDMRYDVKNKLALPDPILKGDDLGRQ